MQPLSKTFASQLCVLAIALRRPICVFDDAETIPCASEDAIRFYDYIMQLETLERRISIESVALPASTQFSWCRSTALFASRGELQRKFSEAISMVSLWPCKEGNGKLSCV